MVPDAAEQSMQGPDPERCYWCDVPIEEDGRCPECGRRQTRICFCGQELEPGEDPCPFCGAGWSGLVKVRRKHRRHGRDVRELIGYSAAGILVALLLAALFNGIVGRLALRSAENTELPEAPAERLALAWVTVRDGLSSMAAATVDRLGGLAPLLLIALIGGLMGVLYYLRREGSPGSRRHDEPADPGLRRRRRA